MRDGVAEYFDRLGAFYLVMTRQGRPPTDRHSARHHTNVRCNCPVSHVEYVYCKSAGSRIGSNLSRAVS